jgi:competence protein ComEC
MNGLHHGTKYANSENFIQATTPNLVIFSANENNQYGHPHPESIQRYENTGIRTLQTGLVDDIVIQTDGTRCSLLLDGEPEQPCYSGVIVVPEFPFAVIVLVSALVPTILLSKRKTGFI